MRFSLLFTISLTLFSSLSFAGKHTCSRDQANWELSAWLKMTYAHLEAKIHRDGGELIVDEKGNQDYNFQFVVIPKNEKIKHLVLVGKATTRILDDGTCSEPRISSASSISSETDLKYNIEQFQKDIEQKAP